VRVCTDSVDMDRCELNSSLEKIESSESTLAYRPPSNAGRGGTGAWACGGRGAGTIPS